MDCSQRSKIKVVDPWRKPPFWFDDLGLNDDLIERKKFSFLSNYPELTQAVGVILFTSLFASNFSLLFSTFDMFVGIKFPFKRIQNETYIKWSGRLGVFSGQVLKFQIEMFTFFWHLGRVPFKMVSICVIETKKSGINSFDFQPSKMKFL